MIRCIEFISVYVIGLFTLNKFIFPLLKTITSPNATAVIVVMILSVFTVVVGVVVSKK